MPKEVLERIFVNGFKAQIRAEVRLLKPVGLGEIMEIAQRIEERNDLLRREGAETKFSRPQFHSTQRAEFSPTMVRTVPVVERPQRNPAMLEKTATQRRDFPFRKLSDSGLQEKRDKGLCFRCDEKFTFGHRCKKELRIMLFSDEDATDY